MMGCICKYTLYLTQILANILLPWFYLHSDYQLEMHTTNLLFLELEWNVEVVLSSGLKVNEVFKVGHDNLSEKPDVSAAE